MADDEPNVEMEKSCPVPLSVTVCKLPPELSVIVSIPLRVPLVVGLKKTSMEQLELTASVLPQAFTVPKSAALTATVVIVSAILPVLVKVTLCGRLELPTYWSGKLMLEGVRVTSAPKPVPVRGTVIAWLKELLATLIAALRAPGTTGVKVTVT